MSKSTPAPAPQDSPETPVAPPAPGTRAPVPEPVQEQQDAPEGGKGGNAEAAKYRLRLRETEAERDTLSESVESLRRQLVAGAMPHGSNLGADALWTVGRSASEFFDANGQLDAELLRAGVKMTSESLGISYGIDVVPSSGQGSGSMKHEKTWADALKR